MRYLAVDLGDKRTGLAIGDRQTGVVAPLGVAEVPLSINDGKSLVEHLAREVEKTLSPKDTIVFGLPLNMDGTEGPRTKIVRAFAARLEGRTKLKVVFQDERLTSSAADWQMARSGMTHQQKKERRDALAAATILNDYFSALARAEAERADAEHAGGGAAGAGRSESGAHGEPGAGT